MRMFEKLGDELEWKHKTKQTDSRIKSKEEKIKLDNAMIFCYNII